MTMNPLMPADYVFRIETTKGVVVFSIIHAEYDGFGEIQFDWEATDTDAMLMVMEYFDAHGSGMDGKPVSILRGSASPIDIERSLMLNKTYLQERGMNDPNILGYSMEGGPMPPDGWTFSSGDTAEDHQLMESSTPGSATDAQDQAQAAMKFVLVTKRNEYEGCFRKDIGWIAFLWGSIGRAPTFADGEGIANIIAKQDFERRYLPDEPSGEELCARLVDIVARGAVYRRYGTSSRPKIDITWKNEMAIVRWHPGKGVWMLDGYRQNWGSPSY